VTGRARAVWTPAAGWTDHGPTGTVGVDDTGRLRFEPDTGHPAECTGCEHDCVRARRSPNPTRMVALGAETCRFCDDHDDAADAGYGGPDDGDEWEDRAYDGAGLR